MSGRAVSSASAAPQYSVTGSASLDYGGGTQQFAAPAMFTTTSFVDSTTRDRNYDVSGANGEGDVFDLFVSVQTSTARLTQLSITRPQENRRGGLSYNFPLSQPIDWLHLSSPVTVDTTDHAYSVRIARDATAWRFDMKRLAVTGAYSVRSAAVTIAAADVLPDSWRGWTLRADVATDTPTTKYIEQFNFRRSRQ
jgi:hypothetical protein